jgi:hypothetical protein
MVWLPVQIPNEVRALCMSAFLFVMATDAGMKVESGWNVMAHGDAREGKWRGNRRMEWVSSTLHTTSEHGLSSITTADAHTPAASTELTSPPI